MSGTFSDITKSAMNIAPVDQFSGLIGLGLSLARMGDIMVVQKGLQHVHLNSGGVPAVVWSSFSIPDPGLQLLTDPLFGNNFSAD